MIEEEQSLSSKEISKALKKKVHDRYVLKIVPSMKVSKTKKTTYRKYLQTNLADELQLSKVSKNAPSFQKKAISHLQYFQKNTKQAFRSFCVSGWRDNFYSNLLDFSFSNNLYAGYENKLSVQSVSNFEEDKINIIPIKGNDLTSIKHSPFDNKVALGFAKDSFKIIDLQKNKIIMEDKNHLGRISVIQWRDNMIISGCKDERLRFFDIRKNKVIKVNNELSNSHIQQVCGIKKYSNFIASGGNDNKVFVYDIRKQRVFDHYEHNAAVKAISWKNQKMLMTGGGTADKKIKLWSNVKKVYSQIQTGSQVCSLSWSESTSQIISCQGFSLNQIIIWSQIGEREYTFHGHSSRVLYSVMSPSGQYLATGAGDKTLKVWKLFKGKEVSSLYSMGQVR